MISLKLCSLFLVVVICVSTEARSASAQRDLNYPLNCMLRYFNFTGTTTDSNGRKCRGSIHTRACFGSCESFEYGTYEFPYIVTVNPTCNYGEKRDITTTLTDCDEGVEDSARTFTFPEALSCACNECNPTEQNCKQLPTKRRSSESSVTEIHDEQGQFGNYVPTRRPSSRKNKNSNKNLKKRQQERQSRNRSRHDDNLTR